MMATQVNKPSFVYCLSLVLYLVVFFAIFFFWNNSWLISGMIIGSVFVFIAFYYFYDHFLSLYLKEAQDNTIVELSAKKGSVISVSRPNIYIWMMQWLLPAISVQVFVVIGFWITIGCSPFLSTAFTHPYMLGKIYKDVESINRPFQVQKDNMLFQQSVLKEKYMVIENNFSAYVKNTINDNSYINHEKMDIDQNYIDNIKKNVEWKIYKIPFLIAFAFGFLGSLIYALIDMTSRFNSSDLYPKTFINYLVRFVFAPSLCLVVAYYMMNDWWINAAPLVFFFVGFFPQRAMQYIEEQAVTILSLKKKEEKKEIPLGMLQGMTDYIFYRFREIGVEDAQNLANSDLSTLRNNLGFSDRQICDFVAQAMLLLYLTEHFSQLQAFGIRNVVSFKVMVDDNNYKQIANALSIPPEKLNGLLKIIRSEWVRKRIETLEIIIREADEREQTRRTSGFFRNGAA